MLPRLRSVLVPDRAPDRPRGDVREPRTHEIRALLALAVPAAATQLSTMLMGFVDTVLLGHVGVHELAAASIANVWIHGTLFFAIGVIVGIDPLIAQAHGRGDGAAAGLAAQRGLVVAVALSLPLALAWYATECGAARASARSRGSRTTRRCSRACRSRASRSSWPSPPCASTSSAAASCARRCG